MPKTEFTPETLRQLNREAAGMFRLEIIRPEDHCAIANAAFCGDPAALSRLMAIFESGEVIRRMARKEGVVCLTCPSMVRNPEAALALLVPANERATVAICSALCEQCSTGASNEIIERASTAYRAAWPGMRRVTVTHPKGGTA